MLDETKTIEYIRRAKSGEREAKELLIEQNVSLVKCIVKRSLGKGVDYDDLFQIACMGFLKAISGFDESFGVKFSTYAVPMIIGEIKRYLRDGNSLRVSRSIRDMAYRVLKAREQIEEQHEEATIERIAEVSVELNATSEDIGARRLHTVMEYLLEDISFNAGGDYPLFTLNIGKKYVDEHLAKLTGDRNLKKYVL